MNLNILHRKRVLHFALFFLLLSIVGITKAQSITVGDLNYSINGDGETVTLMGHVDGQSATGGITIPATLTHGGHTYYVTDINYNAFYGCSGLTGTLAIPNSVTSIGSSAFYNCVGLSPITFGNAVNYIGENAFTYTGWYYEQPDGVLYLCNWCLGAKNWWNYNELNIQSGTIGIANQAFQYCGIGSISLPNSLVYIGDYAFASIYNLSCELVIPNSVTTIGDYAFSNCYNLYGELIIPNSVTYLGEWAFANCNGFDGDLVISNALETIENGTFSECSGLTSLVIGNSVTSIGEGAFYGCTSLASLSFGSSLTEIGNNAFSGCNNLTTVDIPEPVASIGYGAFANCTRLASVTMSNSVTALEGTTFENCTSPLTVTLSNSLETIGHGVFSGCTGLTSITIPESVTSIGSSVFDGCIGLATLNYNAINCSSFEYWGWYYYNWLEGCSSLTTVNIGENVEVIPDGFVQGCEGLTSIAIPNSVTTIGDNAFEYCSNLASVTMGNSVESIGYLAFAHCSALISIDIPATVSTIEWEAFSACSSLTTVNYNAIDCSVSEGWLSYCDNLTAINIGENVETIPAYFAYDCGGLTSIFIPESVTTIEDNAFESCIGLTTITIPSAVAYIGSNALKDCTSLTTLNYNATSCDMGYYYYDNPWLEGCTSLTTINIGENVEVIPYRFAYYCESLASIEIPESVTSIENEAFYGCSGLTGELTIPESMTSIGYDAFYGCSGLITLNYNATNCSIEGEWLTDCTNLTNLTIGDNVETIPNYLVYGCSSLSGDLVIPNAVTNIGYASFYDCSGFTSLTIGSAVESMEGYAFAYCTGLTSIITLAETVPLDYGCFYDIPEDITVYVPCGTLYDYENAWGWYGFSFYQNPECAYDIEVVANPEVGGIVAGAGVFYHGETVTLTATPNEGYYFDGWTKDDQVVSYYSTYEFTAYYPATYVANFERMSYQISASANPYEGGEVDGEGIYYHFDTCTLTAIPNDGYVVVNWMKDGEVVATGETYSFIVTENVYAVATFQYAPVQTLSNGWNWYSTYVELEGNNGLEQLENGLGSNGMVIKSRNNGFVEYYEAGGQSGWFGPLNAIYNEQMYMVRTNAACSTAIVGEPVEAIDHPITIGTGWNWIGFPCRQEVNLCEALAGFTPADNDMFKGRNGYATYLQGYGWFGSLNILEPGQGYMYKSNSTSSKTLTYQTGRGETVVANMTPEDNVFRPQAEAFAQNMTVTAVIELDGSELRSEDYELAAFVNGECRGSVKLMYVEPIDRYVAFLTVFGEQEERISFGLTDGTETSLSSTELDFVADGTMGVLTQPFIVSFRGTTGIGEDGLATVKVYPNPSNGVFHIEGQGIRRVEVFNGVGQAVVSEETQAESFQIDLSDQAKGMYVLRVVTDDGVKINQLIKY